MPQLTHIRDVGYHSGEMHALFKCACGGEKIIRKRRVASGQTRSCGCLSIKNKRRGPNVGPGGYSERSSSGKRSRLYRIWRGMKARCYRPSTSGYARYGGRGITVCDQWLANYDAFKQWATQAGYDETLTLDRVDNEAGYSPGNCRWATLVEQRANRRKPIA